LKNENIKDWDIGPVTLPVINEFKTSNARPVVATLTLSWQVEIPINWSFIRTVRCSHTTSAKQYNIKGFDDGTRRQFSYTLIAYKDLAMASLSRWL
jgi:hypothetical protein